MTTAINYLTGPITANVNQAATALFANPAATRADFGRFSDLLAGYAVSIRTLDLDGATDIEAVAGALDRHAENVLGSGDASDVAAFLSNSAERAEVLIGLESAINTVRNSAQGFGK